MGPCVRRDDALGGAFVTSDTTPHSRGADRPSCARTSELGWSDAQSGIAMRRIRPRISLRSIRAGRPDVRFFQTVRPVDGGRAPADGLVCDGERWITLSLSRPPRYFRPQSITTSHFRVGG